ncbi:sulfite exporter TauE/SafE family protein [Armatimonas sp.]|uniref:sulfite exporter TauE/SafE family protein n=1 Tax=Armatimonas sp. TaxID=1872638 RepID=UPI0037515EBE
MEILGYAAAVIIGITLGLMGGGGSILTVPVLVYLFGESASKATGDSLFIVGVTAALGAALMARRGLVDVLAAVRFTLPAFVTVWLTRHFLLPAIPERLGMISRDTALLVLFAALMLATAVSMLRKRKEASQDEKAGSLTLPALVVGVVTGLVGAGGGFLIVPALTLAAKLPIKRAVGTSLAIIAANSLFGFFSDTKVRSEASWGFLLTLTALAVVGMGIGVLLSKRIPGEKLRPTFGIFLLLMGIYMVAREIFRHL